MDNGRIMKELKELQEGVKNVRALPSHYSASKILITNFFYRLRVNKL